MAMKGNQNNLDQSKDILDIKDRSILSPHVPSDFLAIVYYNPDTWEQLWLRQQLSRTPRFAQCSEEGGAVEHYEGWGGVLGKGGCVCYSDVAICSNFFNCNNSVEQYQIDGFKASQTKSSRMHFCFCITGTRVSLLTMDNLSKVVRDRNQRGDKSNNLHQISNSFPEEIVCLKQKQTQVTKSQIMDEDNVLHKYHVCVKEILVLLYHTEDSYLLLTS